MNKIFTIIKYSLLNEYKLLGLSKKNDIMRIVMYILVFYCLVFSFVYYIYNGIGIVLKREGILFLLLLIGTFIEMFYCTITNIYKGSSHLFNFKDYDLLISMPIPKNIILTTKLFNIYIDNLVVALFVTLPAFSYYGINTNSNFIFYLYAIVFLLLLPLLSLSIGTVFSFLIGKMASKFKKSSFIVSLFSVALVVLYAKLIQNFIRLEDSKFLNALSKQLTTLKSNFIIENMYKAFEESNFISFVIISFICIIPFILLVYIFKNYFTQINSSFREIYTVKNYNIKAMKSYSPIISLIKKEIIHYFTSYMYFLNTFITLIFMTIFTFGYLFTGNDFIKEVVGVYFPIGYLAPIFTYTYCVFITMVNILSSSISLEGKNLWIIKNLPIQVNTIFHSKIIFNLIIILPVLYFNIIVISVALSLKPIEILIMFLVTTLYTKLFSSLYLFINLLFPKMIWTSQAKVIKRGLSVFVSAIVGIVVLLLLGATLYFFIQNLYLAYTIIFIELISFNIISTNILFTKGKILFNNI